MRENVIDLESRRANATDAQRRMLDVTPASAVATAALQIHEKEFEEFLAASPCGEFLDAIVRAKYLLQLFSETPEGRKELRLKLIRDTLKQIDCHFRDDTRAPAPLDLQPVSRITTEEDRT